MTTHGCDAMRRDAFRPGVRGRVAWYGSASPLVTLASCRPPAEVATRVEQPTPVPPPRAAIIKPPLPWYDPAATLHGFGLILAGSDVVRSHAFRVVNRSDRPVAIRRVVNRKPCCGDVEDVAPTTLASGAAPAVPVRTRLGLASGRVVHAAAIRVEGSDDEIILTTVDTARARVTIDEIDPAGHRLAPGESGRVVDLIESFGAPADPPHPLDDPVVRCSAPTEWVDAAEAAPGDDPGRRLVRRRPAVNLSDTGEPGRRAAELTIGRGDQILLAERLIEWEIASALTASPSGLILHPERRDEAAAPIVVRSVDRQPFRILEAAGDIAGLSVAADSEARALHTIRCRLEPAVATGSRTGTVMVRTDHPAQSNLRIAVSIAAPAGNAPPPDTTESRP